ncbi:TPA: phage tail protein [Enterobacter hormaechei subsp. steigerwaltii]|nr:phage tail protein [Enterobacter hormaechei subsp. steigerwaltii]
MLYNTGTIAINGNTATGTGTNWTAPASQIRVGQTLFVLSNPVQMFQITAINSATSLTVTPAASPALSGQKYGILVTDSLSVDGLAQSMSQLISEYDENIGAWETFATTSANQSITVTINGARVTIPAIGKLVQKGSNAAVGVSDGGTGATNAADARTNLGLGDMATKSSGETEGAGMTVGAFGIGRPSGIKITNETGSPGLVTALSGYGLIPFRNEQNITGRIAASSPALWVRTGGTFAFLSIPYVSSAPVRISGGLISNGTIDYTRTLYDDLNTTKASDGTLKAASPVARIVKSQDECQRTDIDEQGFSWCGCGTANAEAEGIIISRLDVGVYVLTGSAGLASEGWQLLPPMDPGGMGELGVVEAEQTESGGITIRLFKRRYMLSEEGEIVKTKGAPIDVPANSWIDVRLDMPEDSIWNTKASEASLELTEQPAVIQP